MGKVMDSIKRAFGGSSRKKHSFLSVGQSWSPVVADKFRDYDSFLEAGTGSVWSTFRACDIVGNAVMQTGYNLIRKSDGEVVDNDRTGLADLMEQPNSVDTFEDLLYLYTHHIKLTGNFFLLKDGINPITKQPEALWPLVPSRMTIVPSESGRERIVGYTYRVGHDEIPLSVDEVIHFKRPNANNPYWGMGDVQAGTGLYNDFINRDALNNNFMKNGGLPSGVLVNEEFEGDEAEWERVKAIWGNQYTGKKNLGKIAWLTGKWNFIKLGLTAEQMQAIEKDKQNVSQIFMNHGVPLSIAGMEKAANYATARQDYVNFKRFTCYPLALSFFRKFNREVVKQFDENYKIDFIVNGLVDGEAVVREYLPFLDRGVITPNQLRDLAGLPKVDNPMLDGYYINTQIIPLEMCGFANAFGDTPNELQENQVESAGGDADRLAEEVAAEAEAEAQGEIEERLLSLRKSNGTRDRWNGQG